MNTRKDCGCGPKANVQRIRKDGMRDPSLLKLELPDHSRACFALKTKAPLGLHVKAGETFIHDIDKGPLKVDGLLIVEGALKFGSTSGNNDEAVLEASEIHNRGLIESSSSTLKLICPTVRSVRGEFRAPEDVVLKTEGQLFVMGGIFSSHFLKVKAGGDMTLFAQRIEAKVKLDVKAVALGVQDGQLEVEEQEYEGDPLYWNGGMNYGGDITFQQYNIKPSKGADLFFYAKGNIILKNLDTTGGKKNNSLYKGRIRLMAGLQRFELEGSSLDGSVECLDCELDTRPWIVEFPETPQKRVEINGRIEGQTLWVHADEFKVTDDIIIIGHFEEEDVYEGSGVVSLTCNSKIEIMGKVHVDKSPATKGPVDGDFFARADNVTINGLLQATQIEIFPGPEELGGSVTINGRIKASSKGWPATVTIYSGSLSADENSCGSGGARSAFSLPSGNIQTQGIQANAFVKLVSTGNIKSGDIRLLKSQIDDPTAGHHVMIHANVGGDATAPVFTAGGGGDNGCGSITIEGLTNGTPLQHRGGVAIGNPGGITISNGAFDLRKDDKGTPAIVLDAGEEGTVTLDDDLKTDGSSSVRGGFIYIVSGKIEVTGDRTISASDELESDPNDPNSQPAPEIVIVTSEVALEGNLDIKCNSEEKTSIRLAPKGSARVNWNSHPIHFMLCEFEPQEEELKLTGDGKARVIAKSKEASISFSGTPLTFSAGTVDVETDGEDSSISITYVGGPQQRNTLVSSGGKLTLNSRDREKDGGLIQIEADGISITGQALLDANAGGDDGDGGTITVNAIGNVKIDSHTIVTANAKKSGDGGTISIFAEGNLEVETERLSVLAGLDGDSDGRGGSITLNANQSTLTLIGDIDVSGGNNNGDGGTIDISGGYISIGTVAVAAPANLDGPTGIRLVAYGNGSGKGGDVTVESRIGSTVVGPNDLMISVDSLGSGSAGSMAFKSADDLRLDGAVLSASAGPDGNGRGGEVTKECSGTMYLKGTFNFNGANSGKGGSLTLLCNGFLDIGELEIINCNGGSDGKGGEINVITAHGIDLSSYDSTLRFSAKGQGEGGGGYFFITGVTKQFDVLSIIKVDAGNAAVWNLEEVDEPHPGLGSIRINNVTCRQWRLSDAVLAWPKRIWLANGNTPASDAEVALWNLATGSKFNPFRTSFSNNQVELFVFPNRDAYVGFTSRVEVEPSTGGETFKKSTHGDPFNFLYVCPWREGSNGDQRPGSIYVWDEEQMQEVGAHELGHAHSIINGLYSTTGAWITAYNAGKTALIGQSAPCDSVNGFFRLVFDLTLQHYVCDGGGLHSDYNALNNHLEVAGALDLVFGRKENNVFEEKLEELHAQLFARAIVAENVSGYLGARPMFHKIIDNGAFADLWTHVRSLV